MADFLHPADYNAHPAASRRGTNIAFLYGTTNVAVGRREALEMGRREGLCDPWCEDEHIFGRLYSCVIHDRG